jgi:putative hydrolase of the HAD superfamily
MKKSLDADFLIFDLGNVIIDIDYQGSLSRIKQELPEAIHSKVDNFYRTDFHREYEMGMIDSASFRAEVRTYFEADWEDQKVDFLWNSLLGKIPAERIELIKKLRKTYQVGVLSNTNHIHILKVNEILKADHGLENFDPIFDWVFLSHEMGLAKPSLEIYERLVNELHTTPDRVIFFDDLPANIGGASEAGIRAIHVTGPEVIFDFFKDV